MYALSNCFFRLDIPSSYAKILWETNFQSGEFPRSGWKAEGVEKKVGENNGQLRFVRHVSHLDQNNKTDAAGILNLIYHNIDLQTLHD